jgi:hypothetical protein
VAGPSPFKTIHAAVRPARLAVLIDRADGDWEHICLRIIEFFSRLWGGAYNVIVPTDGKSIDERFWQILEAFDPDYVYAYRKSGEDVRLARPDRYKAALDAHVAHWTAKFGGEGEDNVRKQIDESLRGSTESTFGISAELQREIKVRLAPFWFQESAVEAGGVGAGMQVSFPLTDLTKIMSNTEHPDRVAEINVPRDTLPRLWFGSACGLIDDIAAEQFEAISVQRDLFDFEQGDLVQLVQFVVAGAIRQPYAYRADKRNFFEMDGIVPFQLSMLQLGLYRSTKYQHWTEPLVLVAGNTVDDFCLYYCLSRLRERVVWVLPEVTESALASEKTKVSRHELNFVSQLRREEMSPRSTGGLVCIAYSLDAAGVAAVIERLSSSPLGKFRSAVGATKDFARFVRFPLTAVERDNFQRDIPIQLSDDVSISPFSTPKPKNFRTIHPYEHRYITQLTVAGEAPPKHWDLGKSVIVDSRMTTHEVRVGKDGPAYFCPNIAYFGGDIDTVLVRPHLRLSPLAKVLGELAATRGYECRPSDKGIYADETIAKWGGLAEVASFLRDAPKRALLDQFLDRRKSEPGKGVYLSDDQRRYMDFRAVRRHMRKAATGLIDDLVSRQVFYRGFIFRCSYCRNSTWFSVGEITQEFRCKRCGRSQVYTKTHWKMPHQPAWFYKLDELVYQGYRQNMAVPLLALEYLRSKSSENFSFTTDREFWKRGGSKPDAEMDFFCVSDGVLIIGEAKKEDRLSGSPSDESREITKYKRVAAGLSARRLVLATFSNEWNPNTRERVIAAFKDMPGVSVTFLTSAELLGLES